MLGPGISRGKKRAAPAEALDLSDEADVGSPSSKKKGGVSPRPPPPTVSAPRVVNIKWTLYSVADTGAGAVNVGGEAEDGSMRQTLFEPCVGGHVPVFGHHDLFEDPQADVELMPHEVEVQASTEGTLACALYMSDTVRAVVQSAATEFTNDILDIIGVIPDDTDLDPVPGIPVSDGIILPGGATPQAEVDMEICQNCEVESTVAESSTRGVPVQVSPRCPLVIP